MFKQDYPNGRQQIETLLAKSAIEASLFLPFTIYRLRPYAIERQVKLTVSLYESENKVPQTHNLQANFYNALQIAADPGCNLGCLRLL
mgnify:CR=1 FL=1